MSKETFAADVVATLLPIHFETSDDAEFVFIVEGDTVHCLTPEDENDDGIVTIYRSRGTFTIASLHAFVTLEEPEDSFDIGSDCFLWDDDAVDLYAMLKERGNA